MQQIPTKSNDRVHDELDPDLCRVVLQRTASLGALLRSDPLFDYLVAGLRSLTQLALLDVARGPVLRALRSSSGTFSTSAQSLTSPSVNATLARLFLDHCAHTRSLIGNCFHSFSIALHTDGEAFDNGSAFTVLTQSTSISTTMHSRMPGTFIALPCLQIIWPEVLARVAMPADAIWHSQEQYTKQLRALAAFSKSGTDGLTPRHSRSSAQSLPPADSGTKGYSHLAYTLHPALRDATGSGREVVEPDEDELNLQMPPANPKSLMDYLHRSNRLWGLCSCPVAHPVPFENSHACLVVADVDPFMNASAILDLHYLRGPEPFLYTVCAHLAALQRRVAALAAEHPDMHALIMLEGEESARGTGSRAVAGIRGENTSAASRAAARALGFRSLVVIAGRGRNASTQGYSVLRCSMLEALAQLDLMPLAHPSNSTVWQRNQREQRPPSSTLDTVTFRSAALWRWCTRRTAHGGVARLEVFSRPL